METTATTHTSPWRRWVRHPLPWLVGAWAAVELGWLAINRQARLFEIDGAGYAAMAVRLARQRSGTGVWTTFQEGNHGPLQALLALPLQVLGPDPMAVLVVNALLGAGTGAVTFVVVRRLTDRRTAAVAGFVVLCTPGILEYSRVALTVMPSVFFASVAMLALVMGSGLERRRWAIIAGIAVGCMTLSRSMTVAFAPAFAVAALAWARSRQTPVRTVSANAALATGAAVATAAWWWIVRWSDVSTYLVGGGSTDTDQFTNPPVKLLIHGLELLLYLGVLLPIVAGIAYVVLRRPRWRRTDVETAGHVTDDGHPAGDPRSLPVWPIAAAAATATVILSVRGTLGVGFMMPVLPWAVVATTVGVRRRLPRPRFAAWSVAVAATSLAIAVAYTAGGMRTNISWCLTGDGAQKSVCEIDGVADRFAWRSSIDAVADRLSAIEEVHPDSTVALVSRDILINDNSIGLASELRHQRSVPWSPFDASEAPDRQLAGMVADASVVVVTDDYADTVIIGRSLPTPEATRAAATAAGFLACDAVTLPDGRHVSILVRPSLTTDACR